ncbi:MAG: ATP-binding cassette domain-containing protein, partial [Gemmatimonadetes bacterium]|nr:ATP-binding cassette domain-containing protein [Gemmatimonadota bacterium]
MRDTAVRVSGLSKQYHIGAVRERFPTLRDQLSDALIAPFRRASKLLRGQATGAAELDETIWALEDISFEVGRGEVVGIIGHNGAGKSTLLKILSRITEPTTGYAEIHGRVGSLLEVGTGFHPELTGRENIYLNGAILGMRRAEIVRKFDEIVAFAEVERFIETPVKHYSTGMHLRLAFAVAAHLEPDILVIDEVLAVGDAAFQRKCLNKMEDVSEHGRTILFVSHNMAAVTRLCERTLLLNHGHLIADGPSHEVVGAYLHTGMGTTAVREWSDLELAPGGDIARLRAVRIRTSTGDISEAVDIRQAVGLEMEYEVLEPGRKMMPSMILINDEGVELF